MPSAVAHAGSPSLYAGPLTGLIPALGIGISFMWYAASAGRLVRIARPRRDHDRLQLGLLRHPGGAAGAPFPPTPIHDVIVAINVLNPLAYMDSLTTHDSNLSSPHGQLYLHHRPLDPRRHRLDDRHRGLRARNLQLEATGVLGHEILATGFSLTLGSWRLRIRLDLDDDPSDMPVQHHVHAPRRTKADESFTSR